MICGSMFDLYIIIFSKIVMSQRELTFEEANKLCQDTLILIYQQNLAEKQKINKNISSPRMASPCSPLPSPLKIKSKESRSQILELSTLQHDLDLEKSPLKKIVITPHKLSIDKESTLNDLLDLSQECQGKTIEKDDNCLNLFHQTSILSQKESKIQTQQTIESQQKGSQLKGNTEQKLYPQSLIKEVKRDLQIQSRGKICKTQQINQETGQITGYHFYCKNDTDCPFDCFLEYTGKRTSKGEKTYRMMSNCENHQKSCLQEEEEVNFMKLTKVIDSMQQSIRRLISQNGQLKPKDILTVVAQEMGEDNHKFIYKGLHSKNYHKAAKKYFDNLIYKVKNPTWGS